MTLLCLHDLEQSVEHQCSLIERALSTYKAGALRGDHTLNADLMPTPPFRAAAVLVPVLVRPTGLSVLFTQRTAHLHAHAGQISFPGGGAEPQDVDAAMTALREAHEEIGLLPDHVRVLGALDPYVTRTGYRVTPVVGLIDDSKGQLPPWSPDDFEVAEIFDVPLGHVLDPAVLRIENITREGLLRQTYVCQWQDFYIWGATAGMLYKFVEAIKKP